MRIRDPNKRNQTVLVTPSPRVDLIPASSHCCLDYSDVRARVLSHQALVVQE